MIRMNERQLLICFALALPLVVACGAGGLLKAIPPIPPTPSTSNESTGSSPMSGDWNAVTDFGRFAFTVDPNGGSVTTAVIKINHFTCGGTTLTTQTQVLNSWPIEGGEFSSQVDLGESDEILYITFDGSYDAAGKTFSGSWDEDAHGAHCSGNWATFPHK